MVVRLLLQLSAQAMGSLLCRFLIQREMFEKRRWEPRGGHVGERERVCVEDLERD